MGHDWHIQQRTYLVAFTGGDMAAVRAKVDEWLDSEGAAAHVMESLPPAARSMADLVASPARVVLAYSGSAEGVVRAGLEALLEQRGPGLGCVLQKHLLCGIPRVWGGE